MLSHNETVKYFYLGSCIWLKPLLPTMQQHQSFLSTICSVWGVGNKYSLWVVQQCSVKSFVYMWVAYHQLYLLIHSLVVHTHPNPKSCAKGQSSGPARRTPKTHHTARTMHGRQSEEKGKEGKGRGGSQRAKSERTSSSPLTPSPRSHQPTYLVKLPPHPEPRDNTGESPRWPPRYPHSHRDLS